MSAFKQKHIAGIGSFFLAYFYSLALGHLIHISKQYWLVLKKEVSRCKLLVVSIIRVCYTTLCSRRRVKISNRIGLVCLVLLTLGNWWRVISGGSPSLIIDSEKLFWGWYSFRIPFGSSYQEFIYCLSFDLFEYYTVLSRLYLALHSITIWLLLSLALSVALFWILDIFPCRIKRFCSILKKFNESVFLWKATDHCCIHIFVISFIRSVSGVLPHATLLHSSVIEIFAFL